jgi:deoxycytidylate deaminase
MNLDILKTHFAAAQRYAERNSLDPITTMGAALVTPTGPVFYGCNRLPIGVSPSAERWVRPLRYLFVEMAPSVAIHEAVRCDVSPRGSVLVCTHFPAVDAIRTLIEVGVWALAAPQVPQLSETDSPYRVQAAKMLEECGVRFFQLPFACATDGPQRTRTLRQTDADAVTPVTAPLVAAA